MTKTINLNKIPIVKLRKQLKNQKTAEAASKNNSEAKTTDANNLKETPETSAYSSWTWDGWGDF